MTGRERRLGENGYGERGTSRDDGEGGDRDRGTGKGKSIDTGTREGHKQAEYKEGQ